MNNNLNGSHIPGEVKKVRDSALPVVISLTSEVTLMSRPTTGGILLKPSNLKNTNKKIYNLEFAVTLQFILRHLLNAIRVQVSELAYTFFNIRPTMTFDLWNWITSSLVSEWTLEDISPHGPVHYNGPDGQKGHSDLWPRLCHIWRNMAVKKQMIIKRRGVVTSRKQLHEDVIPVAGLEVAECSPASVPVQVKGSDLRVVSLKVGEVEEVRVRLGVSGLSARIN